MKPVKQTKLFTGPGTCGNCLSACVSSMLEIPIEEVPNFVEENEEWQGALNEFLAPYNMFFIDIPVTAVENQPLGYHLMCGFTVRSKEVPHSVIAFDKKYIHDPHPSNNGLITVDQYGIFCVLDPSKQKKETTVFEKKSSIYICEFCGQITIGETDLATCCLEPFLWSEAHLRLYLAEHMDDSRIGWIHDLLKAIEDYKDCNPLD